MMKKWIIGAALAAAVAVHGQIATAQVTPARRVLIIPFTTLNVPDSQQWMAKGVQENIVADFRRNGGWSPIAFQGQVVVEDNATAARLGRQASADYAIRGSAQVVGTTVRLTAQLIDTKAGDTLSTAAVTGSPNDLLRMEDELSTQLRVGPATADAGGAATTAPAAEQQPAQPQIIVVTQPNSPALGYDPNAYYNNNGYPYYGWGYPGIWWPVVIDLHPGHHHDHGDDNGPPPGHHRPDPCPPQPTPIHAFPSPSQQPVPRRAGFTLPIPQQPGFALPIPQQPGFALPIPQTSVTAPIQRTPQIQMSAPPRFSAPPMQMPAPRMAPVSPAMPRGPSISRTQFVSYR